MTRGESHIKTINCKRVLYVILFFFIARNICFFYIIFKFTYIFNILSFTFFTSTLKPLILIINNRFLLKSLFLLIKYISAYLLGKHFVLGLFAHIIYLLCAAVSYLQLSAALSPQVIKLVVLTNLNPRILFLIL